MIIFLSVTVLVFWALWTWVARASSLKKQGSLNEDLTITTWWSYQWRMLLLAVGTMTNQYSSNKDDGAVSEDDYDKQALYCILYSTYARNPRVKHTDGTEYEFTFNTWGFYLKNTGVPDSDPQRMGKIAYHNHFNNECVKKYIENAKGKVQIIELGCGTGAGGNFISKRIDCEAYYAVDMQLAAVETCRRKFCPTNPKLKPIHSNILALNSQKLGIPFMEERFDFVLINETHVAEMEFVTEEDKRFFEMAVRLLKPGGFLLWGNCIRDCLWTKMSGVVTSKPGMSQIKSVDFTREAILARDLDAGRVNAYVDQIMDKVLIARLPIVGTKFRTDAGLMLKNFYRHPGTDLYKTMQTRVDSYKQIIFQKDALCGIRPAGASRND